MTASTLNTGARACSISNRDHVQTLVAWMDEDNYPDADDRFDHAPIFNFNDGKVKFDTNWYDNANENYGSVSGFVPKFLLIAKGTTKVPFVLIAFK